MKSPAAAPVTTNPEIVTEFPFPVLVTVKLLFGAEPPSTVPKARFVGDTVTAAAVLSAPSPVRATLRSVVFGALPVKLRFACRSPIAVGEGRRPVEWPADVLVGRQRDPGGRVVPAHGLTLLAVRYPED